MSEQTTVPVTKSGGSLRVAIPLTIALFVILGSLALLLVFERRRAEEISSGFVEMARVNAAFLQRSQLTRNESIAGRLSEVMGVKVFFLNDRERPVGPPGVAFDVVLPDGPADGQLIELDDDRLMVRFDVGRGREVIYLHEPIERGLGVVGADGWLSVGVFWILSLGLGVILSRRITQPLQQMVASLPAIGSSEELGALPVERGDEIGSLARALVSTHESLQSERELRRRAQRHAILGTMAAGMAHEVRNPVAAIRLHAELLDPRASHDFQESRRLILGEAERLESLVSQWLNYARPEPPSLQPMDVDEAIREAVERISPRASHARVTLKCQRQGAAPLRVSADRLRIRQVLDNLLLNAVQAMPNGGEVEVSARVRDSWVEIEVADQGAGFSAGAIERLGEPFYSEKEGGMGLGLAVSRDICQAHGGALEARNRESGGACVTLRLPVLSAIDSSPP